MRKNILILAIISVLGFVALPVGAVCDYYSVWPQNNNCAPSNCCCCCPSYDYMPEEARTMSIQNNVLYQGLRGKIIVRSQANGEAYFVDSSARTLYYLSDYEAAYDFFTRRGAAISGANLSKIPVGVLPVTGEDSDRDGLADRMELAVGTNKNSFNSDYDIYSDKVELENNYNPNGSGRMKLDINFAKTQAGKFLAQSNIYGVVWYVSPRDNRRYFVGNQYDALNLIKQVGVGMSEENFYRLIN